MPRPSQRQPAEAAAQKSLEIVRRQLELGAISYLALLNAEQTEPQARVPLAQAAPTAMDTPRCSRPWAAPSRRRPRPIPGNRPLGHPAAWGTAERPAGNLLYGSVGVRHASRA